MSDRGRPEQGRSRARGAGAWIAAGALLVAAACGGDSGTGPSPSVKEVDVSLSVGQSQRITADGSVLRVNVPGPGSGGAEYRLAVQSASQGPGTTVMRLSVDGEAGASSSVSARRQAPPRRVRSRPADPQGYGIRRELQRKTLEMLQREGVRPSDGERGVRARTMLPTGEVPSEGDELEFWFPDFDAQGNIECDTTEAEKVTATVRAVNDNGEVAMVEGNEVDDGSGELGGGMDYQALADEFDETVFGTDVAYFGPPSDIDGNERVLVLFTNKVNEFSAERTDGDDPAFVGGFFLGSDLADSGDDSKDGGGGLCPASNEAEVLWLIAPDPDGSTGERALDVQQATRQARSTASHEFQHLLNLGNRLFVGNGDFGDAEATWLDEGLSHLAEEIIGLDESGVALRDNLTLSDVTGSESQDSIFNTFLIADFANFARHLQATTETMALAGDDPQDSDATLRMRGFGWGFLRWLADREHAGQAGATPGSGDPEEQFFRRLAGADGSLETGVDNVEAATSAEWASLLADFGLAVAVDDDEPQAPDGQQVLTWDLRDVYQGLNEATGEDNFPFDRQYPLVPTQIGFSSANFDFEVQAGTGRYFTLGSGGSGPDVTLELTDQSGSALTSGSPQITIIRTE